MADPENDGRVSRRDLIGRGLKGAAVGGTMLWAAPAISSLSSAGAQTIRTLCGCCYCYEGDRNNPSDDVCSDNGRVGPRVSAQACQDFCNNVEGLPNSEWCGEFAGGCTCRQISDPGVTPGQNGCRCA